MLSTNRTACANRARTQSEFVFENAFGDVWKDLGKSCQPTCLSESRIELVNYCKEFRVGVPQRRGLETTAVRLTPRSMPTRRSPTVSLASRRLRPSPDRIAVGRLRLILRGIGELAPGASLLWSPIPCCRTAPKCMDASHRQFLCLLGVCHPAFFKQDGPPNARSPDAVSSSLSCLHQRTIWSAPSCSKIFSSPATHFSFETLNR